MVRGVGLERPSGSTHQKFYANGPVCFRAQSTPLFQYCDRDSSIHVDVRHTNCCYYFKCYGYQQARPDGWYPIYVYHGTDGEDQGDGYAQAAQDRIILALIAKLENVSSAFSTNHFFVDLAANDAKASSNTAVLEEFGWNGLCIEPNSIYWYHLAKRKCVVAAAFVGGKEDSVAVDVTFRDNGWEPSGGIVGEEMDNTPDKNYARLDKRYTVSLPTLFRKFDVPHQIDYLSLDIEGAESLVMRDFPFGDYVMKLMTVERP